MSEIIYSKHIVMQTKTIVGYLAPEIEVNFVEVERGIAASSDGNVENPDEGWSD